ncbi:hypothetical protein [Stenotrophomonas acidaminiphila]|uniref:hypothetical protein n=1 Tax=Stenotrophomonas acidaminiphila TaxID=128780 RepID=UPI0024071088|nr:hypothetical protein [Stenotrophomonas acidaminiphila]
MTLESFKQSPGKVVMDDNGYAGLSPEAVDQIERLRKSKGWGVRIHDIPEVTDKPVLDKMMKAALKSAKRLGIKPQYSALKKVVMDDNGYAGLSPEGVDQIEPLRKSKWWGVRIHDIPEVSDKPVLDKMMKAALKSAKRLGIKPQNSAFIKGVRK